MEDCKKSPLDSLSCTDENHTIVLKLSESDPLFHKKEKLLQSKGYDVEMHIQLNSASHPKWARTTAESILQVLRIMLLDEAELYFREDDSCSLMGYYTQKNELEALNSMLSHVNSSFLDDTCSHKNVLQDLREAIIQLIRHFGDKNITETTAINSQNCPKENFLLQWGEKSSVKNRLQIAYIEGFGRGAIAVTDLKVGDIALEIPVSAVISEDAMKKSDMFPALEKVDDGISTETMLLLWSMKERYNSSSTFKNYFDTLPEEFNTACVMAEGKGVVTEVVFASSSRLTEEKLAGVTNFQQWRRIVVMVLTGREQHHHLMGERSTADTKWDTTDSKILGEMWNSMESHVAALVTHVTTVKDLWDYLDVLYSGQNNLSRIYEVSQKFFRADRKGRPLTQFFADFKQMYEELNYLLPITSDVKKMQEQREQLAVMGFLGALGPKFDVVRSQILEGNTVASLTETFFRVLRVSRESSKDKFPTSDSIALAVQGNRDGGRGCGGHRIGGNGRGFGSGSTGCGFSRGQLQSYSSTFGDTRSKTIFAQTCHYYGVFGHVQRFCYKLHGRPPH